MGDKADAGTVFTEFTNSAGWPNLGLAVLVGQITPIFSFLGTWYENLRLMMIYSNTHFLNRS